LRRVILRASTLTSDAPRSLVNRAVLQLHIVGLVDSRKAKRFVGPGPKVQALAACAAERTVRVPRCVNSGPLTCGTTHNLFSIHRHARAPHSCAQSQFKRRVDGDGLHAVMHRLLHKPDRHYQPVGANLRDGTQARIQCEPQQLKTSALGKILLKLPCDGDNLLRRPRVPE